MGLNPIGEPGCAIAAVHRGALRARAVLVVVHADFLTGPPGSTTRARIEIKKDDGRWNPLFTSQRMTVAQKVAVAKVLRSC